MSCALAEAPAPARVPIPSGRAYRATPLPPSAHVTPALAAELARVLERFADEAGYSAQHPVEVLFKPGVVGHHQVGRAADIYAVGGRGLDAWKADWDAAAAGRDLRRERQRNLGWRLYKAVQTYGHWSQPTGYPIQLFGPWTRSEGPWRQSAARCCSRIATTSTSRNDGGQHAASRDTVPERPSRLAHAESPHAL